MLYEYILKNYDKSEPIFSNELKGYSQNYIRQEMKRLTDEGKINRLYNGVYYIPYKTILGTEGKVSINKFIEKKYTKSNDTITGYSTGLFLANKLGFTSQNPSHLEICSNSATTKQRKINILGYNLIIYKPVVQITETNINELQFLDLMTNIDRYSELSNDNTQSKLKKYIYDNNINFQLIKKYLPLYPDKIYKNFYNFSIMKELL